MTQFRLLTSIDRADEEIDNSNLINLNGEYFPDYRQPHVDRVTGRSMDGANGEQGTGKSERSETGDDDVDADADDNQGKEPQHGDDEWEDFNLFNNADDEKEQIERFKELNEDACVFQVCKPISDGDRNYTVVGCPKFNWYEKAMNHKESVEYSLNKLNRAIPDSIANLLEHKVRVAFNPSNEMVISKNRNYPDTQWYTVIITSPIAHEAELSRELKRFTSLYQKLNSADTRPSPGRRFMNFVRNSGHESILNGCKKYMGTDENIIENTVNMELIDMGKKPHRYLFNETMDRFLPDYYIKKFLQDHLHAASWESVSENVRKICYKNYPAQNLPIWENICV